MSFQSLYIGVSGLTAAQRSIDVAAHNLSNTNTDGYSRQRVEQSTNDPLPGVFGRKGSGLRGNGVSIDDVIRIRNTFADTAFRSETATSERWDARAAAFARAEQVLGSFDEGVPDLLNEFWASWDNLSLYPTDTSARQNVLDRASLLAVSFNGASEQLDNLTRDVNTQIRHDVDEINRIIDELGQLNGAIKDAVVGSQTPNDLYDRRDLLLDELAGLAGATSRPDDFGQVSVFIGTTAVVRGEDVTHIEASATNPPTLTYEGLGVTVLPGGAIGARIELVTDDLPTLSANLDDIANGLRDLVNTQHTAGFDLDGVAGVDFFAGTGAADFRVDPAVGARQVAASLSGSPNDGNNAVAMGGLRDDDAVGTDSMVESIAAFGARLGTLALEANSAQRSSAVQLAALTEERAVTNSVNMDEELSDMIRFQRAYESAARVITTVDQLLDVLINRMAV